MTDFRLKALVVSAALIGVASPVSAELVISQMVVELTPSSRTADVLVFNDADERAYVSIEPSEVVNPGTPSEKRIANPDPRASGLLLSSTRLILDPHQKRLVRLAATSIPAKQERVYRVIVKPVVGDVDSTASGLKLLVGYEMLVMVRPATANHVLVDAHRSKDELTLTNRSGMSVELIDGKRCLPASARCTPLPSKRLYAGASWTQALPSGERVEYRALASGKAEALKF